MSMGPKILDILAFVVTFWTAVEQETLKVGYFPRIVGNHLEWIKDGSRMDQGWIKDGSRMDLRRQERIL